MKRCALPWVHGLLLVGLMRSVSAKDLDWMEPDILLDGNPSKWVKALWTSQPPTDPQPPKPFDDSWQKPDTSIVVLIAALRESRLVKTIYDFISKADHPERVHFAVVQQNGPSEVDAAAGVCEKFGTKLEKNPDFPATSKNAYLNTNKCKYFDNIRMLRMKASDAQGPVYARARQAELVRPDDGFCMQIDAHTDVMKGWDVLMSQQWGQIENEYGVITTYPTNIHDLGKNSNNHWEMPILCEASFEGPGLVRNGQASAAAGLTKPLMSPLWAAGLSFSRCHAERNVPNDPDLKGIFSGEEYGRGARLWTHGYDFYAYTKPILGTYYGGEKGNSGSWHTPPALQRKAEKKLQRLLLWGEGRDGKQVDESMHSEELGFFGLGTRRTLAQYAAFSGVDTIKTVQTKHCAVQYTPWKQDNGKGLEGTGAVYSEYDRSIAEGMSLTSQDFFRKWYISQPGHNSENSRIQEMPGGHTVPDAATSSRVRALTDEAGAQPPGPVHAHHDRMSRADLKKMRLKRLRQTRLRAADVVEEEGQED